MNSAEKTYLRDFLIAMAAYVILLIASIGVMPLLEESNWRFLVVLIPVIPVLFGMRAFIRFLDRMDELQRKIQLAGIAFAAGTTGILTFTYGFLEQVGFPPLPSLWVFPLMILLWGLGTAFASRRY